MGSAVSPAIDWFLTHLPAVLTAVDAQGAVFESWPDFDAPLFAIVARQSPDDERAMDLSARYLIEGARRRSEDVRIPCALQAFVGTSSQREARVKVLTAMDGVYSLIRSDPTLTGLLTADVANIASVTYSATADEDDASVGRAALVLFDITFQNHFVP